MTEREEGGGGRGEVRQVIVLSRFSSVMSTPGWAHYQVRERERESILILLLYVVCYIVILTLNIIIIY